MQVQDPHLTGWWGGSKGQRRVSTAGKGYEHIFRSDGTER